MTLFDTLKTAKSEEDVKDAYIKALGLKNLSKNLIDIQTKEIWFEAKDKPTSTYAMFTQLLHYVDAANKKGETLPPFLAVIDTAKAALMKTTDVMPLFKDKTIKWGKSASQFEQTTLEQVSTYIGTHFVSFKIETHEQEFIHTVKLAIKSGEIIRTQITPDNLKQVFDKWVALIGKELSGVDETDYALLFFADIMHDGKTATHENLPARLLHDGEKPVFLLGGKTYNLGNYEGYRQFWMIYHKPPQPEYRNYLLERRDSLIPLDERSFKGAYYTPLAVVDKAYDLLAETLGNNWQKNYVVWDMCCGVGNLEVKHSNPRNVFMSTLDQADIDVMKASKTCVAATRFQYDYLNDDITDDGKIDYSLTNKVPPALRQAIAEGKKLLVLINPPYGETGSGIGKGDMNKKHVEQTRINASMKPAESGYASKELFVQFLVRIAREIPTATLAMFSTLKYVNAPNFEKFRQNWQASYMSGFVVHSKAFDGLNGDFPIGFLIWETNQNVKKKTPIKEITTFVLNKKAEPIGEKKFYNLPNSAYLNVWMDKPKTNDQIALPLSNAFKVSSNPRLKKSCDNMFGYLYASNNDLQHAVQETCVTSSIFTGGNGGGAYINEENLWQAAIVFSVRRLIKPTWLNDRDQFLQPPQPLTDAFKTDCLIWMLFNGSNLTASANDLEWNGKKWSIVNHFIPFTEAEVGAPERFESDFMVQYLQNLLPLKAASPVISAKAEIQIDLDVGLGVDLKHKAHQTPQMDSRVRGNDGIRGNESSDYCGLSAEANAVLAEGKKLWQAYFSQTDEHGVRESLKLNRSDVGWYQIRKALEARNSNGFSQPVSFEAFKNAYEVLGDKLRPQVYELGFMRV